jgi:hypothetical protein
VNLEPGTCRATSLQITDWARQRQAKSWELRTATSYARLMCDQRRAGEARALLARTMRNGDQTGLR